MQARDFSCAAEMCVHAAAQIAVGRDADLVLLHPETLELHSVVARGHLVRTPEWVRGGAFERGPRIKPHTLSA
jgi:seryl-tRNA(Sec) selenium transferase